MGILETISNDREKTRKAYLDAVTSGQMSPELCAQLLQNSDTEFYKMSKEVCHEDMEKYYGLVNRCLEVCSRPKTFMESLGSIGESFVKGAELLQQQPNSTQPTN